MAHSLKEIIARYDPTISLAEASTPPSAWYTDFGFFELEQQTVFSTSWQVIGRADQLRETGQFVTAKIGSDPIAAVRGNDGVLRSFYNVCRHHAAAVLNQPHGKVQTLRCPYHGWTYDLEGKLVLTPEFGGVGGFDRGSNGLVPVQTSAWQGWVFVNANGAPLPLDGYLGADLVDQFDRFDLKRFHWAERRHYQLDCNWKVFVDNYLDGGYHVPHIHHGLSGVLDNSAYSVEIGERYCLQTSPLSRDPARSATAAARQGDRALYYWIYPNFMINIYERVMDTSLVIPRAVGAARSGRTSVS
jgi:choline monooxygenase